MFRMTDMAIAECAAVLAEGGRLVLFCPNRGYPFETHGIYIRGEYRFGNKFLVNYLPKKWRNRLGAACARIQQQGYLQVINRASGHSCFSHDHFRRV